jgi:hypothetical protein
MQHITGTARFQQRIQVLQVFLMLKIKSKSKGIIPIQYQAHYYQNKL